MSFLRHREIFPSDGSAGFAASAPTHRLDEFPAGYSLAGCAPALPAAASPTPSEYALKSSCRSIVFHRTANSVLTVCLTPGGRPRTTRYLLTQSQTIVSVPCFHARSHSCVSGHRCALNPSLCGSRSLMFVMLSLFGTSQPASRRTPKLVPSRNSTKRRLNLHTRPAPPAASF